MSDTPARLSEKLNNEAEKLVDFFQGITSEQWAICVYDEAGVGEVSGWNVRQVLTHIAAAEGSLNKLLSSILAGGEGASEEFDLDRFNQREVGKLAEQTTTELIALFSKQRLNNVDLVSKISQEDLAKTGRHPFLGITTLAEMVKLIYLHDQLHIRDIRRVLCG